MCFSASWKKLYIETLQELEALSVVKQINEEIVLANVCEHCRAFRLTLLSVVVCCEACLFSLCPDC